MDRLKVGSKIIKTLVAITEQDHTRGLMFQAWPPPVMSFPYSVATVRKFWMKNTISPLDLIFCCGGKIISIHAGNPLSLDHIGPDCPTDLVVEMPQGMSKILGVAVGQDIYLLCSLKTIAARYSHTLSKIAQ